MAFVSVEKFALMNDKRLLAGRDKSNRRLDWMNGFKEITWSSRSRKKAPEAPGIVINLLRYKYLLPKKKYIQSKETYFIKAYQED